MGECVARGFEGGLKGSEVAHAVEPDEPVPVLMPLSDGCARQRKAQPCARAGRLSMPINWRAWLRLFSSPANTSAKASITTKSARVLSMTETTASNVGVA